MSRRKRMLEQLNQEIRDHIEIETRDNIERGMSPQEAHYAALRKFGNVTRVREQTREMWSFVWLEQVLQDLRFGLRMLRKSPGFATVAVLTLALGIGANTAIFSLVTAVLLRPLPYRDSGRLVQVKERDIARGRDFDWVSFPNFRDGAEQNRVFEAMAAYKYNLLTLTGGDEPQQLLGCNVSASLFPLLRGQPILGRTFLPQEDPPGHDHEVLLSFNLWNRRFGADQKIIGKVIHFNGDPYTVVGVMPRDFSFPMTVPVTSLLPSREISFWVPLGMQLSQEQRGSNMLGVVARLKPGVTIGQARADMEEISQRLQQQYPVQDRGVGVRIAPLRDELVGDIRPALLVFLGAVTLVLLIACANVASLLIARSTIRQQEIALRAALGASRLRLLRQLLVESVLLALAGGALGLLFASAGISLLLYFAPDNVPRLAGASVDLPVFAYTFAVSLFTGIIFGLGPSLAASRADLTRSLKSEGAKLTASAKHSRLRSALVILELALSLALLIGAGLLVKSFVRLERVNPGFRPDHLLTAWIILPEKKYSHPQQVTAFYQQALNKIEALPSVESVGATENPPLSGLHSGGSFRIEGQPAQSDAEMPFAYRWAVSANFFRTMKTPLLGGREFTEGDSAGAPSAVVVNETAARLYWPGGNPIGKRVSFTPKDQKPYWFQIVGIASDVQQDSLDTPSKPTIYLSMLQSPASFVVIMIRTKTDPASLSSAVRGATSSVDHDQAVFMVRTMDQMYSDSVAQRRFSLVLLVAFAALALVLGTVGIYGVMAYVVAQRTHEIGIRVALGAQRQDVLRLILGQGFSLTLAGTALGIGGALLVTRFLSELLFEVSATDLATFAQVPLFLASVALLACYIPAWRAMRVDPMAALRYE